MAIKYVTGNHRFTFNGFATATNQLSVSIWYYANTITAMDMFSITTGNATQNYVVSLSGQTSGNKAIFRLKTGTSATANTTQITSGGNGFASTDLQNMIGVYDGSAMRLYINGVLVAGPTSKTGNVYNSTTPGFIGGGNARQFNGSMDDVRVYNRALGQNEVITIYNSRGTDNITLGLQLRWTFKDKSPNETITVSSPRNIGPLSIGTTTSEGTLPLYNGTPLNFG